MNEQFSHSPVAAVVPHNGASPIQRVLSQQARCPVSITDTSKSLVPAVAELDLSRLRFKYVEVKAELSPGEWSSAEREYRRFLSLKYWYPAQSLVPSKQVDKIWHAHILDTRSYRADCERIFGRFLDHYPYFGIHGDADYAQLQQAFAETIALYEQHFGAYPNTSELNAARCEGHACHVPSECACRVPGACK